MLAQYATTLTFIALGAIFAYSFYAVLIAGQLSLGQAGFAALAAFSAASLAPSGDDVGDVPALLTAVVIGMAGGALGAVEVENGRAHVWTLVTPISRMPSSD